MVFFDSNVLVYAATGQDRRKQDIALFLFAEAVESGDGRISLQVLREVANVLFRKSGDPADAIRRNLAVFKALPRVPDSEDMLDRGMEIKERHGIQFYDALIVASAEAAGCDTLYSEDLADGAVYGSVRVVSPFLKDRSSSSSPSPRTKPRRPKAKS